jgi:hypothetical protein
LYRTRVVSAENLSSVGLKIAAAATKTHQALKSVVPIKKLENLFLLKLIVGRGKVGLRR